MKQRSRNLLSSDDTNRRRFQREREREIIGLLLPYFILFIFFLRFDEYRTRRYIMQIRAKFGQRIYPLPSKLGRYDRIGWFGSLLLNLITYSIRSKPNTCIRLLPPPQGFSPRFGSGSYYPGKTLKQDIFSGATVLPMFFL